MAALRVPVIREVRLIREGRVTHEAHAIPAAWPIQEVWLIPAGGEIREARLIHVILRGGQTGVTPGIATGRMRGAIITGTGP